MEIEMKFTKGLFDDALLHVLFESLVHSGSD